MSVILPSKLAGFKSWASHIVFSLSTGAYFVYMHVCITLCKQRTLFGYLNPYPTAFPYGNGMVLHFYQQQESSTTKTVHNVINKRLKTYV